MVENVPDENPLLGERAGVMAVVTTIFAKPDIFQEFLKARLNLKTKWAGERALKVCEFSGPVARHRLAARRGQ